MAKKLTEMAAEITVAQLTKTSMTVEEIETYLTKTFNALKNLKDIEDNGLEQVPEESTGPAIDPKRSILKNKVVCLECGKEFKMLTNRHLESHGMDTKEYRQKYGFNKKQPLVAKSLSDKRREVAQKHKLGEKLQQKRKEAIQQKAKKGTPKPKVKKPKPDKVILRKAERVKA